MDVAVSGSTGLIGTALVSALEGAGHRVVPIVRGERPGVRWDPHAGDIDAGGLEGVDAVVHLSGERVRAGRWTRAHKREVLESRTRSTRLLARTLAELRSPPSVMVSASGVHFYGYDLGDTELTEESPPGEGFMAEVCAAWEASTAPADEAGIRVVNVRTGPVLSTHGGLLPRFVMPLRLAAAGRLGSGRQWMSWISLDDHVGALLHLLDSELRGPVNLTAPRPVRNHELSVEVARALHRPRLPPVPAFALRLLFGAQPAREMALASQRVLPARLAESGYEFAHPSVEVALEALLVR